MVCRSRPSSTACIDTEAVAMTPFDCRATMASVANVPPSWWRVTS
jgi:hypothetical protein